MARTICIGDWYRTDTGAYYEVTDIYASAGKYFLQRVVFAEPGFYTLGTHIVVSRDTLEKMEAC